jgi:hypothetical protein
MKHALAGKSSTGRGRSPSPSIGPGYYDLPEPSARRRIPGGAMRWRAPAVNERTRVPAPPPEPPQPPPRALSPTLLRVVERRAASAAMRGRLSPSRSVSPTRPCVLSQHEKEMASRPAPGDYEVQDVPVSPARQGPYARGIVFSSVPRNLDPMPRPPPPIAGIDDAAVLSSFASCSPRCPSATAAAAGSHGRSASRRRASMNLFQQRFFQGDTGGNSSPRPGTQNFFRLRTGQSSGASGGGVSTFGTSKRLLDLTNFENPFLARLEQAPPVGCYSINSKLSARSTGTPRGVTLGRAERVIALERRTAAPGPLSYDLSHFDLAPKPIF